MIRSTLTLLVLATVAAGVLATRVVAEEDGDGMVLRTFDVSAITTPIVPRMGPVLGQILPMQRHQTFNQGEQPEPRPFLQGDQLVDLLREWVRPESWEEDGAWLEFRGARFEVRNRPDVVAEVEAVLYRIAAEAQRRVLLHVEVVEEARGCRASGSVELPPGVRQALAVTSRVDFVADYDVEIAQASNISDPIADHLEEGLVVEAIAHPLLDDRHVLLEAFLQFCCLDDMRTVELGTDEECFNQPYRSPERFTSGILQLPVCSHADLHVTMIVEAGEDVLVPIVAEGRKATLRFHLDVLDPARPGRLLRVSALTEPAFSLRAGPPPESDEWHPFQRGLRIHRRNDDPPRPLGGIEEVLEQVHRGVAPRRWEEGDERLDAAGSGTVVVTSRPDLLTDVRSFLALREAELLRPVALEVAMLSVRDLVVPGPGRELDPELVTVLGSARLATVSGRWASARLGTVRSYLADYDVEVAQESRIPDPLCGLSFGGLLANVRPHLPLVGRTVRVDVDAVLSLDELAPEPFDSGTQYLGPVEQVRARRTTLDTTIGVPLGGRTLIDAGPDPRTPGARLVLAVSAKTP